jgi:hypothetical protein
MHMRTFPAFVYLFIGQLPRSRVTGEVLELWAITASIGQKGQKMAVGTFQVIFYISRDVFRFGLLIQLWPVPCRRALIRLNRTYLPC